MKFIHIADVHWGMNPDSDKSWSWERAQAIKDTFASLCTPAAADASADIAIAYVEHFHLDAFLNKNLLHLVEREIGVPLGLGASVDH